MDHTSGGQRAAEVEATAEQRAEWERRLRARADELGRHVADLARAAGSHHTREGDRIAELARTATVRLAAAAAEDPGQRATSPLVTSRDAPPPGATLVHGRGDQPPFAEDLVVERPPHEQ